MWHDPHLAARRPLGAVTRIRRVGARWLGVAGLFAISSRGNAQGLRGTVMSGTHPVSGAVVVLLDSLGQPVLRALTRDGGEFSMLAPRSGAYTLRVLRIGFLPTTAGPYRLASGTSNAVVRVSSAPVRLEAQLIQSSASCAERNGNTASAFALWEQARTALMAATLTQARPYTVKLSLYERDANAAERRRTIAGSTTQTYRTLPADSLATGGYIRFDGADYTYWAPDADVLLSRSFAESHCLSLAHETTVGSRQLGISFEPMTRHGVADIRGVLWVDRWSKQLRALDFSFVEASKAVEEVNGGGHLDFTPIADGGWIIPHWEVRVPVAVASNARLDRVIPGGRRNDNAPATRYIGGDIDEVQRGGRVLWRPGRVNATVQVRDSAGHAAPMGTLVWVAADSVEAGRMPTTDDEGLAHLDNAQTGTRAINVLTAIRDSLGLPPVQVVVRIDSAQATPIPVTIARSTESLATLCRGEPDAAVVYGGAPPRASIYDTVTVRGWWEVPYIRPAGGTVLKRFTQRVVAGESGRFHLCGVPVGVSVHVAAAHGLQAGAEVVAEPTSDRPWVWVSTP